MLSMNTITLITILILYLAKKNYLKYSIVLSISRTSDSPGIICRWWYHITIKSLILNTVLLLSYIASCKFNF